MWDLHMKTWGKVCLSKKSNAIYPKKNLIMKSHPIKFVNKKTH